MPFRDILGHEQVRSLVGGAAVRGSLPPSLIFSGPAGVGKHLAAVALAQLANCERPLDNDACGECQPCRRIARRVHADVLYIEPGESGSIKIEQVREAIEQSAYRPFEGRRRFAIIDEADAMIPQAQDALLKTLEEPPSATTLVLVTAAPATLLPTILSRCQRVRFGALSPAEIAEILMRRHGFAEVEARAAASVAEGSVGSALEGASGDYVEARRAALRLLETVARKPVPAQRIQASVGLPGGGRGKADRDALAQTLRALASLLRDLGLLASSGDEDSVANPDLRPQLDRLRGAFDRERVLTSFGAVDRALDGLGRNCSPKIVADWLAFQI